MRSWICGIDLGSNKIAGAIGRAKGKDLSLFASASVPSAGVTKGIVTDLGEASSAMKELVDRLEFQSKLHLEGTLLSVQGTHLDCLSVQGNDIVSEKGREVTSREVRQALNQAQSIALPMNRRVLHALLQGYVIDGQEAIRNPIGMYSHRLRVQLKIITGQNTAIQNAVTSVNRAGLEVEGVVFSGYATALAVLEREERNFGCALLEIGENSSSFLTFQGGGVTHLKVFPTGSFSITEKISERFQISLEEAELLKRQHGSLDSSGSSESHQFLVNDGSRKKVVRRGELCQVIREAVKDLLTSFREEIQKHVSSSATLVLAGGTALLEGMVEETGNFYQCRTRLGEIQDAHSEKMVTLPFAASIGVIRYGYDKSKEEKELLPEGAVGRAVYRVKTLLAEYF